MKVSDFIPLFFMFMHQKIDIYGYCYHDGLGVKHIVTLNRCDVQKLLDHPEAAPAYYGADIIQFGVSEQLLDLYVISEDRMTSERG